MKYKVFYILIFTTLQLNSKNAPLKISESDIIFKDGNTIYLKPNSEEFDQDSVDNKCTELGFKTGYDTKKSLAAFHTTKKRYRFCYSEKPAIPKEVLLNEYVIPRQQLDKLLPNKKNEKEKFIEKKLKDTWAAKISCPKEIPRKTTSWNWDSDVEGTNLIVMCSAESTIDDLLCPKGFVMLSGDEAPCVSELKCPAGFSDTRKIKKDKSNGCLKCDSGNLVYLEDIGRSLSLIEDHWLCKTTFKAVNIVTEPKENTTSNGDPTSDTGPVENNE